MPSGVEHTVVELVVVAVVELSPRAGAISRAREFKPDTRAARRKGEEQLDRYVPAVTRYYQQRIDAKQGSDSTRQGAITDEVARQCIKGGSVLFVGEVIAYPLCEKKFECVK